MVGSRTIHIKKFNLLKLDFLCQKKYPKMI